MCDRLLTSPPGPRILIYHQVGEGSALQINVAFEDFRRQMTWLVENKEIVDLDTALRRWEEPGASQLVAITFDDGFRSLYTSAYPLMKDMAIPFTLYVTTSIIGLEDWGGRGASLDWDQLKEMMDSGLMSLGAHTHSHPDLRRITVREIKREIQMNDEIVATRLAVIPAHFAYPWGYWSESADALVRDRYGSAVLGSPRAMRRSSFDPHAVHRLPIQLSDGVRWFRARLEGGLLVEEEIRRSLRGYRGP
jgi:peptidoglycan/xylan/chitin deacetylase (PgdA/CDA1 family)